MNLYFDYTADLPGIFRLHGTVDRSNWEPSEHVHGQLGAAWAFVRGLLHIPGEWRCSVRIEGVDERRVIEVNEIDGTIFRSVGESPSEEPPVGLMAEYKHRYGNRTASDH